MAGNFKFNFENFLVMQIFFQGARPSSVTNTSGYPKITNDDFETKLIKESVILLK